MPAKVNVQEYYLPQKLFVQLAGMDRYEVEVMSKKHNCARESDRGIPVFGMMKALNLERRLREKAMGASVSSDMEDSSLSYDLKYENILTKRILNQTKLGMLVLKEEGAARVKHTLRGVAASIKTAIKNASARLAALSIGSKRDIETILTEEYNSSISDLEVASKVISWEEDGSLNLLQTRLVDLETEDPEFVFAARSKRNDL